MNRKVLTTVIPAADIDRVRGELVELLGWAWKRAGVPMIENEDDPIEDYWMCWSSTKEQRAILGDYYDPAQGNGRNYVNTKPAEVRRQEAARPT